MATTFIEMQHEVIGRLHEAHSSAGAIIPRVQNWINFGIRQYIKAAPWYWRVATGTIALVSTQKEYAFPADYDKVNEHEVRLGTTGSKIYFVNEREFDRTVTDPTAGGTPFYFTLIGRNKIQLYPIPDASAVSAETDFDFEYLKIPATKLVADGDTSIVPDDEIMVPLAWAAYQGAMYSERLDKAQIFLQEYNMGLQMFMAENRKMVFAERDGDSFGPPNPKSALVHPNV